MADPFIIDPALQAEVVRQFNLKGALDPFQLTNRVVPIFDIGRLASVNQPQVVTTNEGTTGVRIGTLTGSQALTVHPVTLQDTRTIIDGGTNINPAALTVLSDTGQLVAGDHMVTAFLSANVVVDFRIELRDAANAVTLASWTVLQGGPSASAFEFKMPIGFSTDERIRVVNVGVVVGTVSTTMQANPYQAATAT